MNTYEKKQEARRKRLLDRAERAERQAAGRLATADQMGSAIPLGQPILVGHHSERRDRRYRERIHSNLEKGFDEQKKADRLRERAASVGKGGISADDPEAVAKLKEKLATLEEKQEFMRSANKAIRKGDNQALRDLGVSDARIAQLKEPDFMGRIGFASYALQNNNANIRRIRERIKDLESRTSDETRTTLDQGGVQVVDNVGENRVQIIFPGKPAVEVRQKLKSHGFRWSANAGAWQRHRSLSALHCAQAVVESLHS